MNKLQQFQEQRKVLNLLKYTSRSGNKMNNFNAYMSETESHIRNKFEVWLKLRKAGYSVWCEPIFEKGIRMDILAYKDGIWINYEILESETTEKFLSKTKNYPSEINIIPIRTSEEINTLELL